ncbi:phosphoglucomutase [Halanaerobium hydrogeniformans]|uniref:Phosphoglucomutase/phosphomannomutase alpha/beta/alpha domain I n=1 Tax=Halanaerobium hydrogeniformans TaxID=656519 RepID=E4RK38_HALHG|nr:phosphoglucomutase [Halanaerobium hydrogeniformans]ADQ14590.1 phosphoglucomutase/phosphomannomutase alpha/beta/alpha domain I [Halanaerobium hydrogeniformans]
MSKINWSKLLSGTDIRGKAVGSKDSQIELTDQVVYGIGISFCTWLADKKNKEVKNLTIAVGHDSRVSAQRLKDALFKGLSHYDARVFDAGLASTPAMFMATVLEGHQYDGAIMITASHLPFDKNGFKFFSREGGLEKEDVKNILSFAAQNETDILENYKKEQLKEIKANKINLISDYCSHLKAIIRNELNKDIDKDKPLAGSKIIVDAGNGAGGFFADQILKDLGADIDGSQFLEADGYFPNHPPNPEDKEAIKSIKKAVVENDADLGIIFDTDVDRAAVVDGDGQAINRNKLIALAAKIVLEDYPGTTIVTDSVTSVGLNKFIENKLGGIHHRFKRGYKNVINEAKRLEEEGQTVPLAIETSGHAAFKENYFLDDGAYMVAKVLIKMANLKAEGINNIGELISDLEEAEIKKEYRMQIELEDFHQYGQDIIDNLKNYIKVIDNWELAPKNYQGIRVNCGNKDWFLLRMSLHDPVLVLNVECDDNSKLEYIKEQLRKFLSNYEKVKLENLR